MKRYIAVLLIIFTGQIFAEDDCQFGEIHFYSNGFHTDIVIQSKDVPSLKEKYADNKYIAVGFGNEEFWKAGNFFNKPITEQISIGSSALLLSSTGVMSVAPLHTEYPQDRATETIKLSKDDYKKVTKYINNSFELSQNSPISVGNIGSVDLYKASQNYHALNTCNVWTSAVLSETSLFLFSYKTANNIAKALSKQRIRGNDSCQTHRERTVFDNIDWKNVN